jgi:hypothetical protein
MITIEIKDAGKIGEGLSEVDIYCDIEGINELKRQLEFLVQGETHVHLASASWAGNELSEVPFGEGSIIVHQATIVRIPK